jgi:asparagine synthase (glutamine-hydrolysing)
MADFIPLLGGRMAGDPGLGDLFPIVSAYAKARRQKVGALLYSDLIRPRISRWARTIHQRRVKREAPWDAYCAISPSAADTFGLYDQASQGNFDPYYFHGRTSRDLRTTLLLNNGRGAGYGMTLSRLLFGIDQIAPLGDIRLLEFCLAIPSLQYILGGQPRSLARRLAAKQLPSEVVSDTRYGLQDPQRLKRHALRLESWRADLDRMKRSGLASSLLDIPRLERLIDTWPSPDQYAYKTTLAHRLAVPRAIHLGQFILWTERGNE